MLCIDCELIVMQSNARQHEHSRLLPSVDCLRRREASSEGVSMPFTLSNISPLVLQRTHPPPVVIM